MSNKGQGSLAMQGRAGIEAASGGVEAYNALTTVFLAAVANLIAERDGLPAPQAIGIGTGAVAQYASSNQNADAILTNIGNGEANLLAQGFQVSSAREVPYVLLWMKRVGSSVGTIGVEIQTDAAGVPSNIAVANGVSDDIAINGLKVDSYGWVRFPFSTPPTLNEATQYHIVLSSADYVWETGVEEVLWGVDTSPTYPDGIFQQHHVSWSAPIARDGIFRVVGQSAGTDGDLLDEVERKAITSRSVQNTTEARLLAHIPANEAQIFIGELGLFTAVEGGSLMAIATINYDKTGTVAVNAYWVIDVSEVVS